MAKTVGILGSGMIGSQVARLAIKAGYDVLISNSRGPETLAPLIAELGPHARALKAEETIQNSQLLVLAIPFGIYKKLSPAALAGKVLIDTLNYYPERDGVMDEVHTDVTASSEMVQQHLSSSTVVKAINNMDFIRLLTCARPHGAPDRSAMPVAGDSAEAKAAVIRFLDDIGYDAVDFGSLKGSWRSEPTTPVYVFPYIAPSKTDLGPAEADQYFATAPGVPVPAAQIQTLLSAATRSADLIGSLGSFRKRMMSAR